MIHLASTQFIYVHTKPNRTPTPKTRSSIQQSLNIKYQQTLHLFPLSFFFSKGEIPGTIHTGTSLLTYHHQLQHNTPSLSFSLSLKPLSSTKSHNKKKQKKTKHVESKKKKKQRKEEEKRDLRFFSVFKNH